MVIVLIDSLVHGEHAVVSTGQVEEDSRQQIEEWESRTGLRFLVEGVPFTDYIQRQWTAFHAGKQKQRQDRVGVGRVRPPGVVLGVCLVIGQPRGYWSVVYGHESGLWLGVAIACGGIGVDDVLLDGNGDAFSGSCGD